MKLDRRRLLQGAAVAASGVAVGNLTRQQADAATATRLEGYADLTSVDPGATIRFFVHNGLGSGVTSTAALTIFRIAHPSDVQVHTATATVSGQVTPARAWEVGCGWRQTTAFTVPTSWPTGLYHAVFTEGSARAFIPFVVKPRTPAATASILCQVPFTTLQAYNEWGGKCLYEFRSTDRVRSFKVSFDRPHANPEWGDLAQWVRPFIRYAARRGLAVDYVSSVDLHARPTLLDPYQLFVTVGHDEYWSLEMKQQLDRFVNGGGNAMILSGNSVYWQIRFDPNPAGVANRVVTCYKDWDADPIADTTRKTVEWEEFGPKYKRALGTNSQHRSIGQGFERGGVWSGSAPRPNTPFVIHRPEHWAFAGTGLAAGAKIAGEFVGYETDSLEWNLVGGRPTATGVDGAPSNTEILGLADVSSWTAAGERGGEAAMTMFRNNGTVFNVGTIDWAKGLTSPTSIVEKITTNVIDALALRKSSRDRGVREMYQYHAVNVDGSWRFVFSATPFLTQKNTGWTYDGQAFWVFQPVPSGLADVVPVLQYHAVNPDGGWNIRYQLASAPAPAGWILDGTAFHAHSTPGSDREAVYQYHAPSAGSLDRVVYTRDPALGLGWTLDGLAFYAPKRPAKLSDDPRDR